MARWVLLLITGAIAGAAAVLLWSEPSNPRSGSAPGGLGAPAATAVRPNPAPSASPAQPGFASARLAIFAEAAAIDDAEALESAIRESLAEPVSRLRDLKLGVLLSRLAEIDPAWAVRLARNLYLDDDLLEPLFVAWALAKADAAIDGVAVIQPPARQRRFALAILRALGDDAATLDRVAAALPAEDRFSFERDALIDRAARDPLGALREAVGQEPSLLQSMVLRSVIRQAADADPEGVVRFAAAIDDRSLRTSITSLALAAWAESDPAAVFDWIEQAGAELGNFVGVYSALARFDRTRLLDLAADLPTAQRSLALQGITQAVAETDPVAAVALLEELTLPPQERDTVLQSIGLYWGRRDPDAALAWAKGLEPPAQTAVAMVLRGVAESDTGRAIDIMLEEIEAANGSRNIGTMSYSLLPLMISTAGSDGTQLARLLDRLLQEPGPAAQSMIAAAMSNWAGNDPDAALNWSLANAERLDVNAFRQIAQRLAQTDLELAVASMGRIPAEHRAGWLEGVAGQLAQTDAARAQSLLAQYRGLPGYDNAYTTVVMQLARTDPMAAARMFQDAYTASLELSPRLMSTASQIAREWARRDPAQAASWALTQVGSGAQSQAISGVVQAWAQTDIEAARGWLRTLGSGPAKDSALDAFFNVTTQFGDFDATLLDAYSSAAAAERGASRAITQIARSDPQEARRLLDTHISDPRLRSQIELSIDRVTTAAGGNVIISSGEPTIPASGVVVR